METIVTFQSQEDLDAFAKVYSVTKQFIFDKDPFPAYIRYSSDFTRINGRQSNADIRLPKVYNKAIPSFAILEPDKYPEYFI